MTDNSYRFNIQKAALRQASVESFGTRVALGYPLARQPGGAPLTRQDDIKDGDAVFIPDAFSKGHWWQFTVGQGCSQASNNSMGCALNFDGDNRHCWLATVFFTNTSWEPK